MCDGRLHLVSQSRVTVQRGGLGAQRVTRAVVLCRPAGSWGCPEPGPERQMFMLFDAAMTLRPGNGRKAARVLRLDAHIAGVDDSRELQTPRSCE